MLSAIASKGRGKICKEVLNALSINLCLSDCPGMGLLSLLLTSFSNILAFSRRILQGGYSNGIMPQLGGPDLSGQILGGFISSLRLTKFPFKKMFFNHFSRPQLHLASECDLFFFTCGYWMS